MRHRRGSPTAASATMATGKTKKMSAVMLGVVACCCVLARMAPAAVAVDPPLSFVSPLPVVALYLPAPASVLSQATYKSDRMPAYCQVQMPPSDSNSTGGLGNTVLGNLNYDGWIGIRLRGATSRSFIKKQYSVELWSDPVSNKTINRPFLNLPSESDFILYGPIVDKTLVQDALAYALSNSIGRYASRSVFVELFISESAVMPVWNTTTNTTSPVTPGSQLSYPGRYSGVYVVLEKIKADKNRIDIKHSGSNHTTGGYIVKIDVLDPTKEYFVNTTARTPNLVIADPPLSELTPTQTDYVTRYMNAFESALASDSFNAPESIPRANISREDLLNNANNTFGYATYIDVDSAVDYLLLTELYKNVDAYRASAYMYKDRGDDAKLVFGPVWDLNLAFGNSYFYGSMSPDGFQVWTHYRYSPGEKKVAPLWWRRMLQDGCFVARVIARWQDLRQGPLQTSTVLQLVDSLVASIGALPIARNTAKYPPSDSQWSNVAPTRTSQAAYVAALKAWLEQRLAWMDANIFFISPVAVPSCTFDAPPPAVPFVPGTPLAPPASKTFSPPCVEMLYGAPDAFWFPRVANQVLVMDNDNLTFAPLPFDVNSTTELTAIALDGVARCAIAYQLTVTYQSNNRRFDPSSWTLYGSADGGASWTPVDARTDVQFISDLATRKFVIGAGAETLAGGFASPTPDNCPRFNAFKLAVTSTYLNTSQPLLSAFRVFASADAEHDALCLNLVQMADTFEPTHGILGVYYNDSSFGWSPGYNTPPSSRWTRMDRSIDFAAGQLTWPSDPQNELFPAGWSIRWTGWLRLDDRTQLDPFLTLSVVSSGLSVQTSTLDGRPIMTIIAYGGYHFVDIRVTGTAATPPSKATLQLCFKPASAPTLPFGRVHFTPVPDELDFEVVDGVLGGSNTLQIPREDAEAFLNTVRKIWLVRGPTPADGATSTRLSFTQLDPGFYCDNVVVYSVNASLAPESWVTPGMALQTPFSLLHPALAQVSNLCGISATVPIVMVPGQIFAVQFTSYWSSQRQGFVANFQPATPYQCGPLACNAANQGGNCTANAICQCAPGFAGADCTQKFDCRTVGNCSNNGICVADGQCSCASGYGNYNCAVAFDCSGLNNCSGHGRCVANNVCACEPNAVGLACEQYCTPIATAITQILATGELPPYETAAMMFDRNVLTKWFYSTRVAPAQAWVSVKFAEPVAIDGYILGSANDMSVRDPRDWSLEGSADGAQWTSLDVRTDETFSQRFLLRFFNMTAADAYQYYRLSITSALSRTTKDLQLSEMQLCQRVAPVVSTSAGLLSSTVEPFSSTASSATPSSATPAISSATPAVSSATPAVSSATPLVSSASAETSKVAPSKSTHVSPGTASDASEGGANSTTIALIVVAVVLLVGGLGLVGLFLYRRSRGHAMPNMFQMRSRKLDKRPMIWMAVDDDDDEDVL
ncbi:hypothetical protein CAOG_05881 [Capsaspora owczarzaki ATCC 30864]|uniref:EGF-like domain-containing protein n=1 Tax=Capsaspora owczarzaki (strain ATCC 30864) TaxID=595528 RepID=A0A0D2UJZ4_CAPO3|nr:hypothetical protein CAOG_05881 [Capsaspora owczarzaki ATCC 30864]KJE95426.1 hypothetical protein CAOG_005881 [Capsaspora owczarzaki ATCC 30864]|eukprot:XP_004345471.2 hypothetical protein CAOG_05881 [Capsaspora owczarzaki ATCC 30864]